MKLKSLHLPFFCAAASLCASVLPVAAQTSGEILSGTESEIVPYVKAWEAFSYPLDLFADEPNSDGDSIHGGMGGVNQTDVNGEGGWVSSWILEASSYQAVLSETSIDTDRIIHQDPFLSIGSFALEIRSPAINGPKRSFPEVNSGELWASFVFHDTGPVDDHDSGLFIMDAAGAKLFLLGKPRNANVLGISHLPESAGDQLTSVSYEEPHHFVARIVFDDEPGLNDDVFLWIDPDENDRLDTFDAGGEDIADIESVNTVMMSRRQDAGSGFFDDICITTAPSLAPAGTVRIDLGFEPNSPVRNNPDMVLHDVISVDSFLDGFDGPGYGHNEDQNYFMVVRGFIYVNDQGDSRVARGIPIDRMSGLSGFMIAPFNESLEDDDSTSGGKNALRFHPDTGTDESVAFEVPEGYYGQCRILVSGDGYGELPAVFEYDDGTTSEGAFQSPDWLDDSMDDGHGGLIPGEVIQINNGMNRLTDYAYFEGSNPAGGENPELDDASFFVGRIGLDKAKKLVKLHLGPSSGSVINVYDLLLDVESDVTPVADWMMY
ncbi:MAG: hypothetical protein JXR73_13445 [Candidatus Omnitrophica bacterium]|nr:hypothetical protein [Candidatus Omnitrophota bacterium]